MTTQLGMSPSRNVADLHLPDSNPADGKGNQKFAHFQIAPDLVRECLHSVHYGQRVFAECCSAAPKQFVSRPTRERKLQTELSTQHLRSGTSKWQLESNIQELRPGRVANNCKLSSFQLRSSVWRKGHGVLCAASGRCTRVYPR